MRNKLAVALALLAVVALVGFGSTILAAIGAVLSVYVFGYVTGALLVDRLDGWSLAIIRTVAGLLLTTMGFLLSLVLSLPWFVGPVVLIAAAFSVRRMRALRLPDPALRFRWDSAAAVVLSAVIMSPVAITFVYMAPGRFPPVFYDIDTAFTLEKVHGFVTTDIYPPESLSNLGIRRTYHYGTQAMAGLISRASGLLPHHALFLIVLPLLTVGIVAGAFAAVRYLGPALPRSVTVPLLLISMPSLSIPFLDKFGPQLWSALTSGQLSVNAIVGNYDWYGMLSNEGPNIGSDFLIVGSVAAIAAAPAWGWTLAAFLIGSAIIVKTTVGIALVAGFMLAEAWRAVATKRFSPSPQMVLTGVFFAATFAAFFLLKFQNNFRVELTPLYHLREMTARGNLTGLTLDILWLLLPVVIVLSAGLRDPEGRSATYLLMAIGPLIVVNISRMDNITAGGGGTGDDWFQILHAPPFLFHAFAISLAGARWARLDRKRRAAFVLALALLVAPVALAASSYSLMVLRHPDSGNDFADNRSLAEALAAIPTRGTVIVTNDLRYPAGNFTRDYRQMQIPALFGHQAFAVNYAHEAVEERRPLQQLLQEPMWSAAIADAARMYHWTHLLIHKVYVHPADIPLEKIFENELYQVFRFPE